jgi:hypothetical protein
MADVVYARIVYFCRETFMVASTAFRPVAAQGFLSRTRLAVAVLAAAGIAGLAHAVPTSFNVNDSSAWTTGTGSGANSSVTFGFDYSSLGIPQAPGSATTRAMILRANVSSSGSAVQGITVSPNGVSLTGDYVVKALVWANSYGGWTVGGTTSSSAGSSQMIGMGVGYTGGTLWRGGATTGGGSGIWFAAAGDGGFGNTTTIRDYSAFTGSGAAVANFVTNTSVYYANASGINPWENFNPYYQTAFPGPIVNTINGGTWASTQSQAVLTGTITNGIAGMAWREFTIERTGSAVTWSIDSTPIMTLSGTALNGVSPDGGVSLTYFDPTSSVAAVDRVFGLVSRFEVVPEPTTLGLLAAIAAGMMPFVRRWRRPAA